MHLLNVLLPTILFIPFLRANPVSHAEWDGQDGHSRRDGCLTDSTARKIADIYANLFVHFDEATAKKYLAEDFQAYSDSSNFINPGHNQTVGAVSVPSRAAFIKMESVGLPVPDFTTLHVWHSCDVITFHWKWNLQPIASIGIDILELLPGTHLIHRDYAENNMLAFLLDYGCQVNGHVNITCPGGL